MPKPFPALVLLLCCIALAVPAAAAPIAPGQVPESLRAWSDWVRYGHEEEAACVRQYDDAKQFRCGWPTTMELSLDAGGGRFRQQWTLEVTGWVALPGNTEHWPARVEVDGRPATLLDRNGVPSLYLKAGSHTVRGAFVWQKLPEFLQVPAQTALVQLNLDNRRVPFPEINREGRLWLQSDGRAEEKVENRLAFKVFRHIEDRIPARVTVRLEMDVSGAGREMLVGPAFDPQEYVPLLFSSPLPARVEPDGRIRIQVRPGRWNVSLTLRHLGSMPAMTCQAGEPPWPDEEVWVFSGHTNLRTVEVSGAPAIDPQQTSLPDQWRKLPAYRLRPGEALTFKEVKRGDPRPAPDQLSLTRNLWLRFDGSGYTIQDTITGTKNTGWRLEMNPPVLLGRVEVDGAEQFITRLPGAKRSGVELRRGHIRLQADSEVKGSIATLPATGWQHDFQQVQATLHLPPGWRLLDGSGADSIQTTWLKRWSLLDIFLVLIITLAVAKLWSRPLAVIAFLTLALTYHEPQAPRWVWLNLLAAVALLRIVPAGRFRQAINIYRLLTLLALVVIVLPFMVSQVRQGIYPQLEKRWQVMGSGPTVFGTQRQKMPTTPREMVDAVQEEKARVTSSLGKLASRDMDQSAKSRYGSWEPEQLAQYDPKMVNQTGPGLPTWQWNRVNLRWSGPVASGQQLHLLLLGPMANLVLAFLRVGLLIVLVLGIMEVRYVKGKGMVYPKLGPLLLIALLLGAGQLGTPARAAADELPSPQLLDQLRERLLAPADCFPNCADSPWLRVKLSPEQLTLTMAVDAAARVAVPLPGAASQWLPRQVKVDGSAATSLFRTAKGELWVALGPGNHRLELTGPLPRRNQVQLPFTLKPHRVEVEARGWSVEGLHANGQADRQLQFKRLAPAHKEAADRTLESGVLPPFARIERTLLLGLKWRVRTEVVRQGAIGGAIVLAVPLLPGEAVTTEGVRVEEGKVLVNMAAAARSMSWESSLGVSPEITLNHAATDKWTEVWKVNVSPIWHLEYDGIPVILHQEGDRWLPVWHPWPEESVQLHITRPEGVAGQTVTVDRVRLESKPGERATDSTLSLTLRSSKGGQHTVTLPAGAVLLQVMVQGRVQPIRQEGDKVSLPLTPGAQQVQLSWRQPAGIIASYASPRVDLGIESVNTQIEVSMPRNRWTLFAFGPRLGPAVLFWSVIIIIVLGAVGLSRVRAVPLSFIQWLLLGIGMSQAPVVSVLLVVGWLLALAWRRRVEGEVNKGLFNLMQIGIGVLTVAALLALVYAISNGLLGHPDMQIVGNGSNSSLLRWYQDHSPSLLPRARVLSIPMLYYRLAMLAWALWVSFALLRWLRWGWECFSHQALWYHEPRPKKKPKTPPLDPPV